MKRSIYLIVLSLPLFSQTPLHIDEVLTKEGALRLDTSIAYANVKSEDDLSALHTFVSPGGDYLTIPVVSGRKKQSRDHFTLETTLRYGVTKDIELYASVSGFYSIATLSSSVSPLQTDKTHTKGFQALFIGTTYQVKKEDKTPALLLGLSAQAIDKQQLQNNTYTNTFKTFRLFASAYYSVDPVVFFLSGSYLLNRAKKLGKITREDGDIFSTSAQLHFALNPYTSIFWGARYRYDGKSKIDGTVVNSAQSSLAPLFGVSYELSRKSFVTVNAEYLNKISTSQATITCTYSYKF